MSHQVIRRCDANGSLLAAGYQWGEQNNFIASLSAGCMLVAICGAVISMFVMKTHVPWGIWLLGASTLPGYCSYELSKLVFRPRSLIFELDGTIRMPHGVPGFRRRYVLAGHHGKIGTIERIRDDEPNSGPRGVHRVAIYSKEGYIIRVSSALHQDDAHLVSVQLTAALEALRDEIGWRARAGQPVIVGKR